jgi:hypothetical protein
LSFLELHDTRPAITQSNNNFFKVLFLDINN